MLTCINKADASLRSLVQMKCGRYCKFTWLLMTCLSLLSAQELPEHTMRHVSSDVIKCKRHLSVSTEDLCAKYKSQCRNRSKSNIQKTECALEIATSVRMSSTKEHLLDIQMFPIFTLASFPVGGSQQDL